MADNNEIRSALDEQAEDTDHSNAGTPSPATVNGSHTELRAEVNGVADSSAASNGAHSAVITEEPTPTKHPAAGTLGGLLLGLVREARPKQWVKNVLVLAVPFTAGKILAPEVLLETALAFVVFSMAASGIYFVNDAKDVESDRAHPTKRNRPIAAGLVPLPIAYAVAALLLAGAVLISALISAPLVVVMVVYIGVQLGYCFGLKHQPVIDMCIVSSGFLLRTVAGGAAATLYISPWFLLVTAFGALFMVAGKRYAEIILAEKTGAKIRKSLESYSASYLRFVWALSAAVVIMTYSQWAYTNREISSVWAMVSIVPFSISILRYAVDVDRGAAGAPDEVVLKDKMLLVLGALLGLCLLLAFYKRQFL
jgi:decaprenyl-phosphate phosphoribosyltransferase